MTGATFVFDCFTPPELSASPFNACVLVTAPANALIRQMRMW